MRTLQVWGEIILSAVSTVRNGNAECINFVSADNFFFFHRQIERKSGMLFMRMKKRRLI